MLKQETKKIYNLTLEIIPFIRFENHNDEPRDLEFMGGFFNNYLSICSSMSNGCFTSGNMLKQNSILVLALESWNLLGFLPFIFI